MTNGDLFPETAQRQPDHVVVYEGETRDEYGHARVVLRLIGQWNARRGWHVGWFCRVDRAVDEWYPGNPDAWRSIAHYRWYRLDELPCSARFDVAAAQAARAARIVLEQMLAYAEDAAAADDARQLSDRVEAQARAWLLQA